MSTIRDIAAPDLSPSTILDQHFVMVRKPSSLYAGHIGAEAIVTDVTNGSVYVLFESGIRDCYPPTQFRELFRRQRGTGHSPRD